MLGIVGFASAIPSLLVTPWGGVVVDRMPKRRLLLLTQSGAMLLAFILAALSFSGIVQAWHIVVLAAGLGLVNAFDAPARQAFVVDMVGSMDPTRSPSIADVSASSALRLADSATALGRGCFTINGISFRPCPDLTAIIWRTVRGRRTCQL
jgi:MFS family permease